MKNIIIAIFLLIGINAFSQIKTVKIAGGGGGGGGGTSTDAWHITGNTNPAEPDSSTFLGTLNATSLRLGTKGRNNIIIDTGGLVKIRNSSYYQIDLQQSGQYGSGNHFYLGNGGETIGTQNPLDNGFLHLITGVPQIGRNLVIDRYTGNPSIDWKLENAGSAVLGEFGQDGISFWTANYGTVGQQNLKIISQNSVNGNFGLHVQIPQYTLQVSPNPIAGSPRAGYPNIGIVYNNGGASFGNIIYSDGTNERWRINAFSKDVASLPNVFSIEQGKNIAGTNIDLNRFVINDIGSVGIGTNAPVASAKLEVTSTTQGFRLTPMTAAQASAISSPAEGLIVCVSDTDGTFTSVGYWGRISGAWAKLNN